MLDNRSYKYLNNDENDTLNYDYNSQEAENKLRVEHTTRKGTLKYTYGAGLEFAHYTNKTFQKVYVDEVYDPINYDSKVNLFLWNAFGQVSKNLLKDRLVLSYCAGDSKVGGLNRLKVVAFSREWLAMRP